MFCSKCGKQINDDSIFCLYCGYEIGSPIRVNEDFTPGNAVNAAESGTAEKAAAAGPSADTAAKVPLPEGPQEEVFRFKDKDAVLAKVLAAVNAWLSDKSITIAKASAATAVNNSGRVREAVPSLLRVTYEYTDPGHIYQMDVIEGWAMLSFPKAKKRLKANRAEWDAAHPDAHIDAQVDLTAQNNGYLISTLVFYY